MTVQDRQAGGIDFSDVEELKAMLPSMGSLLNTFESKDIAHATYVFDYIKANDKDPRVVRFSGALAEEYASRFAEWLGFVFLNRANKTRKSKQMKGLEEGLATWVESLPAILDKKKPADIESYLPDTRFLNIDTLGKIGRKVVKVLYADWGQALTSKMASGKTAGMWSLPISYDKQWRKYVIPKSDLTFKYRRELSDLGFEFSRPRGEWFTDTLDSDILRMLPQAGKLKQGPRVRPPKTPSMTAPALDTADWFFDTWLPENINRFTTVFNNYGRAEGVPYEFKFSVTGRDVDVDFRRNIKSLKDAIAELRSRYGGSDDREGWMMALDAYTKLKNSKGNAAMHAIDMANNLEHSHGAMMEHFPPGVRSWYPAFLDFKYTAHPRAMIKRIGSEDLRVFAEELLPLKDRMERLVTPKIDYRTPKGLALEISSQPGKANKRKMLKKVQEDHPDLYPEVKAMLEERGLHLASIRRIAHHYLRRILRNLTA